MVLGVELNTTSGHIILLYFTRFRFYYLFYSFLG